MRPREITKLHLASAEAFSGTRVLGECHHRRQSVAQQLLVPACVYEAAAFGTWGVGIKASADRPRSWIYRGHIQHPPTRLCLSLVVLTLLPSTTLVGYAERVPPVRVLSGPGTPPPL